MDHKVLPGRYEGENEDIFRVPERRRSQRTSEPNLLLQINNNVLKAFSNNDLGLKSDYEVHSLLLLTLSCQPFFLTPYMEFKKMTRANFESLHMSWDRILCLFRIDFYIATCTLQFFSLSRSELNSRSCECRR